MYIHIIYSGKYTLCIYIVYILITLAILMRSLPGLCENSTAYTQPVGPTISDTCDTVVPAAAPI